MHDQNDKPTKQQVREWLGTRRAKPSPLPDMETLRRQIGWRAEPARLGAAGMALHRTVAITTAD